MTDDIAPLLPIENLILRDERTRGRVVIAPSRGGMVTRFDVEGRPVLYLDAATLGDPTKNVRGGNPVLFPSPGPLAGDRFAWGGRSGSMKQHGFARNKPWAVVGSSEREATLELVSDDETRAVYPWDFVARIRVALERARLTVETTIANRSSTEMPFAYGFHPYFEIADAQKARASLATKATKAYDNVTKAVVDVKGPIDLTAKEVDLHLFDHGEDRAVLDLGDGAQVIVSADEAFGRWVVWTLAGKSFVCVEPWTAGANALNTGESLLVLGPGAERTLTIHVELAGKGLP